MVTRYLFFGFTEHFHGEHLSRAGCHWSQSRSTPDSDQVLHPAELQQPTKLDLSAGEELALKAIGYLSIKFPT